MRVLLVCPIPLEFVCCRSALGLRDAAPVLGCKAARGSVANVDVMVIESGPAKVRAASAAVGGIGAFQPDVVLDTGTCGALDGELIVGGLVLATSCIEYDIAGDGLPSRVLPVMKLSSLFDFLPQRGRERLVRGITSLAMDAGLHLRPGVQACGEFLIQSEETRESLRELTGAIACNWESAAVFVAALRSRLPPLSLRVVTDLGDENTLRDLKRNARRHLQELFRFVRHGLEAGWFVDLYSEWRSLPASTVDRLPKSVLNGA